MQILSWYCSDPQLGLFRPSEKRVGIIPTLSWDCSDPDMSWDYSDPQLGLFMRIHGRGPPFQVRGEVSVQG